MKHISIVLILIFLIMHLQAQEIERKDTVTQNISKEQERESPIKSYFKISGDAGAYGELYTVSGRERRRPPASGRLYFRPTLTLLENFSISFDFLLSTEGSSARQQINQLAIHPTWKWGRAHIGDFSHEFSRFTLSGISIRGAGVELYPGIFRFQVIGGQTQRAIKSDAYSSTYSRYMGGMKIGIGKEETSYLDIIFLKSKDNTASLSHDVFSDSVFSPIDSTIIDTSYTGNSPKENTIIGAVTSINLFNNLFRIRGEVAGSMFTRDLYSQEVESGNIPDFLKKIFKPRLSSNADYAYSTELLFNYDIFDLKAGYSYIGPGYTSLGLSSLSNDRKLFDGRLGFRFFENRIMIQGTYMNQKDNLLSQKEYTTTMNTFGANLSVRPVKEVFVFLNFMNNQIGNNSEKDSTKVKNVNTNYSLGVNYQFSLLNLKHTLTSNYSIQVAKDLNIMRQGKDSRSQNIGLSLITVIDPKWSVSPSVSVSLVNIQSGEKNTTVNTSVRVMNRMLDGRLSNSGGIGYVNSNSSSSVSLNIQSSFALTSSHSINMNARSSFYKYKHSSKNSFNEHSLSLGYAYRF